MHPAKTQISLGIHPVWSESLQCTQWVAEDSIFLHVDSEDSDQTGRMPRLIWVFDGHKGHFVGFVMRWLFYPVVQTATMIFNIQIDRSGHLNQTTPKGLHCLSFCWHLFYGKITLIKLQQFVQVSDDFLSTFNFFHMRKHEFICTFQRHMIWATAWQNKENDLCAQQRLRSAWASAQSDQSLLSAWGNLGSSATHRGHCKDSDQTGWMHRLIWVVAWSTCYFFLVLTCTGSFDTNLLNFIFQTWTFWSELFLEHTQMVK